MAANKRRMLLLAGLAGAGALFAHPRDSGAAHDSYFAALSDVLKDAGIATPTMMIDRTRLHANAQAIMRNIAGRMQLRLVAKSLPCVPLLDELMQIMQTSRLMVFNLPYLLQLAQQRGNTDLLLGKPLPATAAAQFYRDFKGGGFQPERQLQWLVDTPERLAQYRDLARAQELRLRINIEIDVGLHRGGIDNAPDLQRMIDLFRSEPRLQWTGMMGYDPHIAKLPDLPGVRSRALAESKRRYAEYAALARNALQTDAQVLTFNTAGSPTYRLHDGSGAANEVALGSALVMPGDFDTALLQDLLPAAFIATPVLKAQKEFLLPDGVEWLSRAAGAWDVNQRRAYFIYGGNWLADPVSPAGMSASSLYGASSNQQVFVGSGAQNLQPDDFLFFRPRQSEAVLQQFGDIVVVEGGRITERWPVMPALP